VFWHHSLIVAQSADALAACAGLNRESAFTAGLLHDIGRLVLVTCFPEQSRRVAMFQRELDCHCGHAEQEILGLDHAMVGAALARRWKFAPMIQQAIALHHQPATSPREPLVDLVHVADVTAHALDLCGDPCELVPPLDAQAWGSLGLQWPAYLHALGEIERRSAAAGSLMAA
jgi:putative nucleotidyltransferase with HDIG domain